MVFVSGKQTNKVQSANASPTEYVAGESDMVKPGDLGGGGSPSGGPSQQDSGDVGGASIELDTYAGSKDQGSPTNLNSGGGRGGAKGGGGAQGSAATGFQDIRNYLDANKGGGAKVGKVYEGQLGGAYDTASQGIGQGLTDFTAAAQGATSDADPYVDYISGLGSRNDASGAATDLTFLDEGTEAFADYGKVAGGFYGGPQSLGDYEYDPIRDNILDATRLGTLSKTNQGLNTMLSDSGNRGTRGEDTLNSALFQQTPGAQANLQNYRDQIGTLGDTYGTANTSAMETAGNVRDANVVEGARIGAAFDPAYGAYESEIEGFVGDQRTAANEATDTLLSRLQGSEADEGLIRSGVTVGAWDRREAIQDAFNEGYGARPANRPVENDSGVYMSNRFMDKRPGFVWDEQLGSDLNMTEEQWKEMNYDMWVSESIKHKAKEWEKGNDWYLDQEGFKGDIRQFDMDDLSVQDAPTVIHKQNVATQEDYDRLQALNRLSGQTNTYLMPDSDFGTGIDGNPIQPTAEQIQMGAGGFGTAPTDIANLNLPEVTNDMKATYQEYRRRLKDAE